MRRHVVAFGGGHGLAASLSALRHVTENVTAIVTVADDGGSSGRLRKQYDILPPGDLRMALAALCDDSEWGHLWRDVLQHRFGGEGELAGHAVGNLLIVGLWDLLGDSVHGLDLVGRLLGARGRVLPMAAVPLAIMAEVQGHDPALPDVTTLVRGQAAVAKTPGRVLSVRLDPPQPPACDEALTAVREADWVVLGPGSWFTSVMPHLLVPQLADALRDTAALRILTLNLEMQTSETQGYSAAHHLESLRAHAPDVNIDVVLADPQVVDDRADLEVHARRLGAELVVLPVARPEDPARHDPLRLAAAYRDIIG
ncbi:gluconeogenesis factor YvcK family protein [Mobilicoccus massiliensis]|uniref:gluconeogenesis factor YvcK family protein n=1 Tax=Mobilicoccus massiliensis TaxID=1522310 RepID=UPI0005903E39|nr:uridine diphosphate-N-acetylglucosamine-binding protein YvcK [Mobilicoccus massiliensis]